VGSGKSVLVYVKFSSFTLGLPFSRSAIINHVKSLDAHENQMVAFYFFDFRDAFKQSFNNLVTTLLSQLSSSATLQKEIYLAISKLYDNHEKLRSKPSDRDLIRTLKEVISAVKVESLFIIIDGLDEMENQAFKPFVQLIEELNILACSHLHLLIASRPHISYAYKLEQLCSKTVCIDKEDVNADVGIFLSDTMQNGHTFYHHGLEAKNQIIDSLTRRANGM